MKQLINSIKYYITFFAVIGALTYVMTFFVGEKKVDLNNYTTVTIAKGDTVWGLAMDYSQHHDLTFEEFVHWVEKVNKINKMKIENLSPGEKLYIPVLKEEVEHLNSVAIEQ